MNIRVVNSVVTHFNKHPIPPLTILRYPRIIVKPVFWLHKRNDYADGAVKLVLSGRGVTGRADTRRRGRFSLTTQVGRKVSQVPLF